LDKYGPSAEPRLRRWFEADEMPYPPDELVLLVLKRERLLELWARSGPDWKRVRVYPVQALSGGPGPKLHAADFQVPEGIYQIESLKPDSSHHLALTLNYPNQFDRLRAREDGRPRPTVDVDIHGGQSARGDAAIGDRAVEELFCLVTRMWPAEVKVIIAPCDLRAGATPVIPQRAPDWYPELLRDLREAMAGFEPAPGQ
jgi:murein L,D-transpeptidase YafK